MFKVSNERLNMYKDLPPQLMEKIKDFDKETQKVAIERYHDLAAHVMSAYVEGICFVQYGYAGNNAHDAYLIPTRVFEEVAKEKGWTVKVDDYASTSNYSGSFRVQSNNEIISKDNEIISKDNEIVLTRYDFPSSNLNMSKSDRFRKLCELTGAPLELVDLYDQELKDIDPRELQMFDPNETDFKTAYRNRRRMSTFCAYLTLIDQTWKYNAGWKVWPIIIGEPFQRFEDAIRIFHQQNERSPFKFTLTQDENDKERMTIDMNVTQRFM